VIAAALLIVPVVALLALALPALRARATVVLIATGVATTGLAFAVAILPHHGLLAGGHLRTDATSRLFVAVINPIFLGISVYVWHRVLTTPELRAGIARTVVLALVFLAGCNAVLVSNHLMVMWMMLEVSTFAAAPMIVRPGSASSRMGSWHFFLFSSVGLSLVLLGFLCLGRGAALEGHAVTYFVDELVAAAPVAAGPWTHLGIALIILGLGTKLGLAPMYSWLPEAYDQAPPAVTALLGSVQFNATLVVLLRIVQIYRPQSPALVLGELVTMGLASMAISTTSIIATRNVKRLIAYASINHAGVIAIGLGIGKSAGFGLLLYVISNAFIKAILFLTAGKIKAHYGTKDTRQIGGLIKDLPYSGLFLMVGTFALLGFPPFGSFLGELIILSGLVRAKQVLVFVVFCSLISLTFVATGRTIFPMIWGTAKREVHWPRQSFLGASPKLAFLVALVAMGLYMPLPVNALFRVVAASLGAE
jgi:hydrogenase-4 component F